MRSSVSLDSGRLISSEYANAVFSPDTARTPTPWSMLKLPVFTMPSSRLHPSLRDAFRTQLRITLRFPRHLTVERGAETNAVVWDGTRLEAPTNGEERRQTGPDHRPIAVAFRGGAITVKRRLISGVITLSFRRIEFQFMRRDG